MNTAESTVQTNEESLGQRLKAAREKCSWSEEEVAKRLKLRICVIQALEKNDYDIGIPNTYVQGYLKNYARLVGLSEEDIRSVLDSLKTIPPMLKPMGSGDVSIKPRLTIHPLTYLVAFVLLTVLVLIWQTQTSKSTLPLVASQKHSPANIPQPDPAFLSKQEWPIHPLQN